MPQYDVFISFKNTDSDGKQTRDSVMAEELYLALSEKGISTFFSNYTLADATRADFQTAIDEALETAQLLVAVGTCRENLESDWVKDEINQFRAFMKNKKSGSKRAIISYRSKSFAPEDLPSGLQQYQSFENGTSVARFVEDFLARETQRVENPHYSGLRATTYNYGAVRTTVLDGEAARGPVKVGDILLGRYEISHQLGKTNFSTVFLARDKEQGRFYAVKESYRPNKNQWINTKANLCAEMALVNRLDHPMILKYYEILEKEESLVVVMDHAEGWPLSGILKKEGALREDKVLRIARAMAQVLDYLHSQPHPIIYRDLKPANIIMSDSGALRLVDFGAAREYKEFATGDTQMLGTIGYAAPEQFGGMGQSDCRTDIYNLGATLYHLATGNDPAEPPCEILPVRQVKPGLSRGLEYIIGRCVKRDPSQRFQSAKELLNAIDHIKKLSFRAWLQSIFCVQRRKKTPIKKSVQISEPRVLTVPVSARVPINPPVKPMEKTPEQAKPVTDPQTLAAIEKLIALEPEFRRVVIDMIERLSK